MRKLITIETHQREVLVDITEQVDAAVRASGIENGIVTVYAQGATAAVMIQENWDGPREYRSIVCTIISDHT